MPPYAVLRRSYLGDSWDRIIFRTRVLVPGDDPVRMIEGIVCPSLLPGDIIVLSSRAVSACQGQLLPAPLRVRLLSRILAGALSRTGSADSLVNPTVIEAAMQHKGIAHVLAGTVSAAFSHYQGGGGSLTRQARVAGLIRLGKVADLPVYSGQIVLPPRDPGQLANRIWKHTGYRAAIVSVIATGVVTVVGLSHGLSPDMISTLMLDSPLGHGQQQTPALILRKQRSVSKS